jgi:hypothetical protein
MMDILCLMAPQGARRISFHALASDASLDTRDQTPASRLIHLVLGMALRSRCERLKSSSNLESRRAVGLFGLFGA